MKRKKVESSMLASIGYDEQEEVLEVEFNHGGIYQYFHVPKEEYEDLMNADSIGSHFREAILGCYSDVQIKARRR